MKLFLISPYHSGSHQAWAEGYRQHSRHDVQLLTLPGRFWKWRMHGAAVTLARRRLAQENRQTPDLILATDMLDLTTFLALTRHLLHDVPVGLYLHENQLTYPLPQDGSKGPMRRQRGERDLHYVFINYASMMTADFTCFNSRFHRDDLFAALPNFLKHFPDYNELDSIETLRAKSHVLPVGIDLRRLEIRDWRLEPRQPAPQSPIPSPQSPPLITWNQRWEYDKNPQAFFRALYRMAEEGIAFRLALCGKQFSRQPDYFEEALTRLSDQIIHVGFADAETYARLLWDTAVSVSTAHHEFFGISILEAIYCHSFPILPHRLSYPEIIPEPFHLKCLYENEGGLLQRLRWALTHRDEAAAIAGELAGHVSRYGWETMAPRYDEFFHQQVK